MSSPFYSLLSFRPSRIAHATALTAGLVSLSASLAVADRRPDGQFFFDHAPRLVQTETGAIAITYVGGTTVSGTTYEFTIAVPKDAGAPLHAVTIVQDANPNQSRAIAANGTNMPLVSIGGAKGKETTIAFEQPIQPGETVTVSLKTDRNLN